MAEETKKKSGPKPLNKTKIIKEKKGYKTRTTFDNNKKILDKATENAHTPAACAKRNTTKAIEKVANEMVQGKVMDFTRQKMMEPDENGHAWFERFINTSLTEAETNPNSRIGILLASNLFSADLLEKMDAEREKMLSRDIAFSRYRLTTTMFDKQIEYVSDRLSKNITNMSSRRAGKTESNGRKIVDTCLTPNSPVCYIHLTFQNGIDQLYDIVLNMAEVAGLGVKEESRSTGTIEFVNGSVVRFRGNANKAETEKVRGFKYRLVIVDEAQSQRNLRYLVEDILSPLMIDYADSQLILSGTPPRVPHTYFEEAFRSKEYKSYHWDMRDNPYIPNVNEALEEICRKKGLTMDSPLIQREYLGLIVYDTEALLFKNYKTYTGDIPEFFTPERVYIGVDFGFSDYNAVISLAADLHTKKAYILRESKFNKATVRDIISDIEKAYNQAKDFVIKRNQNADLSSDIACYCDTNEESISYELSQTYRIPTYNAYKYDKMFALEQLAQDMRTGKVLIQKGGPLADECERTVKKRDDETDAILNEIDDDVFHPDAMMGLLYAYRQMKFDFGEDAGGESTSLKEGEV